MCYCGEVLFLLLFIVWFRILVFVGMFMNLYFWGFRKKIVFGVIGFGLIFVWKV